MSSFIDGHVLEALAGEAMTKYKAVRQDGTVLHGVKLCGAGEVPLGVVRAAVASAGSIGVILMNKLGTIPMVANVAIAIGELVYCAPSGYVTNVAVGKPIGMSLSTASAQGDFIEVITLQAVSVVGAFGNEQAKFGFLDDFISYIPASSSEALWATVLTDSGVTTLGDVVGGMLVLAASDGSIGDNDENYLYTTNELFLFAASRPLWAEARVKLAAADSDAANVQFGFVSAVGANAILDNGGGPPASYSGAVIFKVDGGTAWQAEASIAGTQTTITLTSPGAPGTSYQKLGLLVVPTSSTAATFFVYVDGVLVGSGSFTYTSATEMALMVGVKNGGSTVNTTLHVDYILAYQVR